MGSEQASNHKVTLSFTYRNGWHVSFFDSDRRCTLLPRKAFFNSEEALTDFVRRAGGIKTLEDRNIFEMQLKRNFGDVNFSATAIIPSLFRRCSQWAELFSVAAQSVQTSPLLG
jgi:hypothetical protein